MSFWSKLVIVVLALLAGFYIWTEFFDTKPGVEKKLVKEEVVEPEEQPDEKAQEPEIAVLAAARRARQVIREEDAQ